MSLRSQFDLTKIKLNSSHGHPARSLIDRDKKNLEKQGEIAAWTFLDDFGMSTAFTNLSE